jgi:hypothetical protein
MAASIGHRQAGVAAENEMVIPVGPGDEVARLAVVFAARGG